jgi:hypothetical protein
MHSLRHPTNPVLDFIQLIGVIYFETAPLEDLPLGVKDTCNNQLQCNYIYVDTIAMYTKYKMQERETLIC